MKTNGKSRNIMDNHEQMQRPAFGRPKTGFRAAFGPPLAGFWPAMDHQN